MHEYQTICTIHDNIDELTDAVKTNDHKDAQILINTIIKELLKA